VGLHNKFAKFLSNSETRNTEEFPRVEYVKGIENPRESSKNLLRWLVAHGYSDEDIGKVLGGNVMRVLRAVWK
jgi:membrane dipeptidase